MNGRRQVGGGSARRAFSLVELLIVVAIIALLVGLLVPTLGLARRHTRATVCRTQLAGLVRANMTYAGANRGFYAPAASDIFWGAIGNLHRWHGVRANLTAPFDPARGPLARFMGHEGLKRCPSFVDFRALGGSAYEAGSGGYGYSDLYVGSRFWESGFHHNSPGQQLGATVDEVGDAGGTMMFADAAVPQRDAGGTFYAEESFAYSYYRLGSDGELVESRRQPSIHFRHLGKVNVGWCDSHVSVRGDFHSISMNSYGADPSSMGVGWFGPKDNSLFDLE